MIFCYYCILEISKKILNRKTGIHLDIQKCVVISIWQYIWCLRGKKLLRKNEDDALVFIDVNDGFKDMKILFKEQFELHLTDMKTLKKNISRFKVTNQKWGRDNCDAKDEY